MGYRPWGCKALGMNRVAYKHKHLFPAVLEVGGPRSWHQHTESLVRFRSQAADGQLPTGPPRQGDCRAVWGLFFTSTISMHGSSTSQYCLLIPPNWALGFQYVACGRTQTRSPWHRAPEEAASAGGS